MTAWCPLCGPLAAGVGEAAAGARLTVTVSSVVGEPVERYAGRYRVPSARLPGFDYGRCVFFVTVVTAGRVPWFGRIVNGRLEASLAGRVVAEEWARTGNLRADVTLDAFVVMPDHVHGILALGGGVEGLRGTEETPHGASLRPWRPRTLGAVVNHSKGGCTRRIRLDHPEFAWQSRFHDVIIRDDRHLDNAQQYILNNPSQSPRS